MKVDEFHPHNNDKVLNRLIESNFSCSSMSDAKWVRLLDALTEPEELIRECRAKLVWDDNIRSFAIDGYTSYEFDYWRSAVEGLISGPPRGWYSYKEIEWIEFPKLAMEYRNLNNLKAGTHQVAQNLDAIEETMAQAGEFDIEHTRESLRMYAYRSRA